MPLRLKLLIAVIVLVFAGLAVSDVVTYTSLRSSLLKRVDQQLESGAGFVLHQINEPNDPFSQSGPFGSSPLPPGTYGVVLDGAGHQVRDPAWLYGRVGPRPVLPSMPPPSGTSFSTGSVGSSLRYRCLAVRVRGPGGDHATLLVAVPLTEVSQTLGRLRVIEGLVTASVLVGLGVLSWWLVRRGLRPLEEIGVTAGAIAAGDLTRRVADQNPRTEVGRLGLALNAMLAQIEEAFAERKASEDRLRRFLADASHELRTPLTSIRGYAELFRRGARQREEDLAKSMRRIEDESARMGIMVQDLLLLARLDQDRPLERELVDLAAIAADAVEDARAMDGGRHITLEASHPVIVLGDEARLRQVAANLMANAIVHTPPGTPVTVRADIEGGDGVLEVADAGPGISPEMAGRAFEPFHRADASRDRSTGGAGLGLAIVAAIAKAHGGEARVDATPGGGATFRVLIPREEASQAGSALHPAPN
jgi:two-component system OmpR family sensor kinase